MKKILYLIGLFFLTACSNAEPAKTTRDCPNWSDNPVSNYANTDFSNFGCSYHANINAQVMDKQDLVSGTGSHSESIDRETVNMQKYMTATPQALPSMSTSSSR